MAGQIKQLIDQIILEKSKGNAAIAASTRTKLILKGINVPQYTDTTPDDEKVIEKVRRAAIEMGITL